MFYPRCWCLPFSLGGGVLIFQKTFSGSNLGSLTSETARYVSSGEVKRLLMEGRIKREDVAKALFIKFPYEEWRTRGWGYQFPGFRKPELTPTEMEDLISGFRQSKRFYYEIKDTIIKEGNTGVITGIWTPEMKQWKDAFDRFHEKADRAYRSGEFQVYMKNGRIGTVTVWWNKGKVGFHDIDEKPWVIGFSEPVLQLVQQVSPRVEESQIEIVFPELEPEEATRKAEKQFGDVYRRALAYVKDSKALQDRIRRIMEIRPALAPNYGDWWQGAGEYTFTFKVTGEKAQAAVKVKDTYQSDWKLTGEAIIDCGLVEF